MSFIEYAADSDFSIHNIPFGVFSTDGKGPRCGSRIGDVVVDLGQLNPHFVGSISSNVDVFDEPTLNGFMALGRTAWKETRTALQKLLSADEPTLRDDAALRKSAL